MIVIVNLARNAGDPGLTLHLFHGPDAIDPDGFELAEVAGAYGRFEADVTATVDPAATYRAIITNSGGQPIYEGWYRPTVGDVVDQPGDLQPVLDAIAALRLPGTGDRRLPIRAQLDSDADAGIPGTRFRVAGSTEQNTTGTSGDTFLDLDPGEYAIQVVVPDGYEAIPDQTITIAAAGDVAPLVVELVPLVPIEPAGPGQTNLFVRCYDEAGLPEEGVKIYGRVANAARGSSGRAHDGTVQHELSGPDGLVVMKVPRLTRYQVRRGEGKEWTSLDIGDVPAVEAPSFVGMP